MPDPHSWEIQEKDRLPDSGAMRFTFVCTHCETEVLVEVAEPWVYVNARAVVAAAWRMLKRRVA